MCPRDGRVAKVGISDINEQIVAIVEPAFLDIAVEGGSLRVARWGSSSPAVAVIAAHGITASSVSWAVVASLLQDEITVIAPDLRGRGGSNRLPGPYGMAAHARDLVAVADALGIARAIVVGHSMGGFVATSMAVADPARVQAVVLVDGGLRAAPLPAGIDLDRLLEHGLGPALGRLRRTFESRQAYREFWRAHPALAGRWSPAVQAYVDYDLSGEPGAYRSKVVEDAVRADFRDLFSNPANMRAAERVACPIAFLHAPRGLRNEPPGQYPAEVVRAAQRAIPALVAEKVPDCNHYTILTSDDGATRVASHIRLLADQVRGQARGRVGSAEQAQG